MYCTQSRLFDRGLTKSMLCIVLSKNSEVEGFRLGLTKRMYSIVPSDRRGAACGVRRGSNLKYAMHCTP